MKKILHSLALKMVFSNRQYVVLACGIFTVMFLALIYVSEYLFISPYLTLYVPDYGILGFAMIVLVSSLTGLVLSMAVYSTLALKDYIVNMTKRKTSIQREELRKNLGMFNKTYAKKFNDQLELRESSHYDSIVSNRITVAHKEPVMITIKDLMEWHELAQNVPKKFSNVLLDGNIE